MKHCGQIYKHLTTKHLYEHCGKVWDPHVSYLRPSLDIMLIGQTGDFTAWCITLNLFNYVHEQHLEKHCHSPGMTVVQLSSCPWPPSSSSSWWPISLIGRPWYEGHSGVWSTSQVLSYFTILCCINWSCWLYLYLDWPNKPRLGRLIFCIASFGSRHNTTLRLSCIYL